MLKSYYLSMIINYNTEQNKNNIYFQLYELKLCGRCKLNAIHNIVLENVYVIEYVSIIGYHAPSLDTLPKFRTFTC